MNQKLNSMSNIHSTCWATNKEILVPAGGAALAKSYNICKWLQDQMVGKSPKDLGKTISGTLGIHWKAQKKAKEMSPEGRKEDTCYVVGLKSHDEGSSR
jgi:hypothetical protein